MSTIYDVPAPAKLDGSEQTFREYEGDVLLLVNVASQCVLTPQYEGLEALYRAERGRGFSVIAFPSNDFGEQEPGTRTEIAMFCSTVYNVTFPISEKIAVNGAGRHPLYAFLTSAIPEAAGPSGAFRAKLEEHGIKPPAEPDVLWNFEKFLIDRTGRPIARFAPNVPPDDPLLTASIEKALTAE